MKRLLPPTVLLLPFIATAQIGTLDPAFGNGGKAIATVSGSYCSGECVAEQADGKIIVGGATPGFALLVRFNADGSLDSGFGTNGMVLTDVDASNDFISAVAVQSDQRIIAGGVRFNSSADGQAIVMRHLPDGSLDNTFGTSGIRTLTVVGAMDSYVKGLAVQPDGKIVVAGQYYSATGWASFATRLNADGTTDAAFGLVLIDITPGSDDYTTDMALMADGRVILGGTVQSPGIGGMFVARLNPDGTYDTTFDSDGKLVLDVGGSDGDLGNSLRVQSDGKILIGGLTYNNTDGYAVAVTRLLPDGTPDPGFGSNGTTAVATLQVDDWALPSLALQPDGKVLIGVDDNAGSTPRARVIRLLDNGLLDPDFGINGIGTSNATSGNDFEYAVRTHFLADGGIVVAGFADGASNIELAAWKFRSGVNVGLEEGGPLRGVTIAPNPTGDQLNIIVDPVVAYDAFSIRDMAGREVLLNWSSGSTSTTIDISGLPPGQYTVTTVGTAEPTTARFIKQ